MTVFTDSDGVEVGEEFADVDETELTTSEWLARAGFDPADPIEEALEVREHLADVACRTRPRFSGYRD